MVDDRMLQINIGWVVLLLLAFNVSCEEKVGTKVDDVQEELPDKLPVNIPQVPACDSENDPSCKSLNSEDDIYSATDINKETANSKSDIEHKKDATAEINDAGTTEDEPVEAEFEAISSDPVTKSDETDEGTEHAYTDNNETNATSNYSTVFHFFKYVVEQLLDEFKDGIYSKHPESTNTTEANQSVSTVNETVESKTENTTETAISLNVNKTDTSNDTDNKKVKFHCTGRNITDNTNATVKLITSARLLQLLTFDKNETENMTDCLLVMFYAPWCHFCARTAPHYNAVARAFPQLDFVAVDTAQFSNLLARFGTVSVPNILIFHQSRAAVKFNQTERTFENLVSFIHNATGLEPNTTVNVTESDYIGPVSSVPTNDTDYLLLISWIFVIFCSSCMFVKSQKGQQWITRVRILWQEHQHID